MTTDAKYPLGNSDQQRVAASHRTDKVLVLGSDTRSFLTVVRSLGKSGKEVHVAWFARDSVAIHSKYVHASHRLSRPPSGGWETELRCLLDREQFDLIVPCNDPSILPLHDCRDEFEDYPIYLVDGAIFDTVMDKAAMSQVAVKAGLQLAKEVVVESASDYDLIDTLSPPYVIKPTQSYVANNLSQKNHVSIQADRATALACIEEMLPRTPVAVQEYFEGVGVGVEFLAKAGEILVAFQHQRLHEPRRGGGSSYRKSCPLDPDLRQATAALIRDLGYTGIGMAEYRYNSRTCDWIFVELNSRFWGSLPLAVACGADFPAYLFGMWCEERTEFPVNYRTNYTCRNWMLDAKWLRQTVTANRFSLSKHTRCLVSWLAELRYPLTFRESSDTFHWDDTEPAKREFIDALVAIPRRIRSKLRRSLGANTLSRARTKRRLMRCFASAKEVLFVCKGNICRSPFAEHYARTKLPTHQTVRSSGYFPKIDRASPEAAQAASVEFKVNLQEHRSSVISDESIDRADTILVFDEQNWEEIVSRYPRAKRKTFLLGGVFESVETEIADPYGSSTDNFQATYQKIREALDILIS
ncbi:MAG: hypothetical protein P1U77_24375 [Rubripirellula sp.]|nr:hypothetical protein [Rubripirellula sp.]